MTTTTMTTYEAIAQGVEQLTPDEQERLMELLEDLADVRAYDAAIAEGGDPVPWEQAKAEIERERAALGIQ